jgi:hypothetical protein
MEGESAAPQSRQSIAGLDELAQVCMVERSAISLSEQHP